MPAKEPISPDEISPEWLTRVLRQRGFLNSSSVKSIGVQKTEPGKAWLSTVLILSVEYDSAGDNAPGSFVLKMLSESRASRDFRYELDAYSREINFYTQIAPNIPVRLPELYYYQNGWYANLMLMEDLSSLTPGDLLTGMTHVRTLRVLVPLAKVHAAYWGSPELNSYKWLPSTNNTEEGYARNWLSFKELCGGFIEPGALEIGHRIGEHIPWLIEEISKRPQTLTNDDMKEDNLLFGEQGSGGEVVILDWQFVIKSMGAIDAARLIGGSELPSERSGRQFEALRCWYDTLLENGVRDYSWHEAKRDFKLGALYNLLFPVRYHKGIVRAEGRALEYIHALYSRLFSFAVEIEADSVLP